MQNVRAKRFLDIEVALRWAYRDELPKRQRGGSWMGGTALSPVGAMFSGDEQGDRDPGFPAALGEPHPDALLIEASVKGLDAWFGHGFGPDPTAAGLMYGIEHMELDHVQAGVEAVAAMAAIVAVHARTGTRPAWPQELPKPFPDRGGNGKPRVLIDEIFVETLDNRGRTYFAPTRNPPPGAISYRAPVPAPPVRKGAYRIGSYCPLVYRPVPARVLADRAEYAAWRMGLELLCQALAGKLASIAPLPAAAPWRPWAGEGELHGRVPELFKGRREDSYRRETREQAAARRRSAQRRALHARTEQTRPTRASSPGERENGTGD
jgi:hypothetical protein